MDILNEGVNSAIKKYKDDINPNFIKFIADEVDPSPTKKYTEWLTKSMIMSSFRNMTSDQDNINIWHIIMKDRKEAILQFDELVKGRFLKGKEADIWSYQDLFALQMALFHNYRDWMAKKKVPVKKYKYKGIEILHIETKDQAKKYGYDTRWCIAAAVSQNQFDGYNEKNNIFYVTLGREKFAVLLYRTNKKIVNIYNAEDYKVKHDDVFDFVPKRVFDNILSYGRILEMNSNNWMDEVNYNFELGDRVEVIDSPDKKDIGKIGTLVEEVFNTKKLGICWHVTFDDGSWGIYNTTFLRKLN